MGSVVIEDVGTDIARYHRAGMTDDIHDRERARAERRRTPSGQRHTSQSSSYPYSVSRQPSSAAAPQLNTQNVSTSFGFPASQQSQQRPASSRALENTLHGTRSTGSNSSAAVASSGNNESARGDQRVVDTTDAHPDAPVADTTPASAGSPPSSPQLLPTVRSSLQLSQSSSGSPTRIKVKSLSHIHSFASEEALTRSQTGARRFELKKPEGTQYEISEMPVTDIIEMVAGLLTKITTTNDRQHQHERINNHIPAPEGKSAVNQQTASVLAFHGKNVPSITILSYLSRIHKYCPTTYEVFLSLLVYFDRMTETVNNSTLSSFKSAAKSAEREILAPGSTTSLQADMLQRLTEQSTTQDRPGTTSSTSEPESEEETNKLAHCFVVDSFNIHRLVIAGVTCASKFFSDVFYTNSRYAKVSERSFYYNYSNVLAQVGGLPIHELNHLELQFLLLNDFRLSVPVEDLEAYGSMLVEFYASEVVAQQMSQDSDDLYMNSSNQSITDD